MDGQKFEIGCERVRALVNGSEPCVLDQLGDEHIFGCRDCLEWLYQELPHRDYLGLLGSEDGRLRTRIRQLIGIG